MYNFVKSVPHHQNYPPIRQRTQTHENAGGRRQQQYNPGTVIRPVRNAKPPKITSRRLAEMRYEKNQRLIMAVFNGRRVTAYRQIVDPYIFGKLQEFARGMENRIRSVSSVIILQEETFKRRKRLIEENSEKFAIALQETSNMDYKVDEELYNTMVAEAEKKLLEQWEAYQKQQLTMEFL